MQVQAGLLFPAVTVTHSGVPKEQHALQREHLRLPIAQCVRKARQPCCLQCFRSVPTSGPGVWAGRQNPDPGYELVAGNKQIGTKKLELL